MRVGRRESQESLQGCWMLIRVLGTVSMSWPGKEGENVLCRGGSRDEVPEMCETIFCLILL